MGTTEQRVVDTVQDGEQDVVRSDPFVGSGDLSGVREDPGDSGRAADPVLVTVTRWRADDRSCGTAHRVHGEPVVGQHRAEPRHAGTQGDRGEEQVLGVDEAVPDGAGFVLGQQGDLPPASDFGHGDGEHGSLHPCRIRDMSTKRKGGGDIRRRRGATGTIRCMEQPVVGLVVHPSKNVQESVEVLDRWNASGAGRLVARRIDAARLGSAIDAVDDDEFTDTVDLVVALGGDGTMLGAMRLVARRPVPVLGVNYGNVGFLVEIEPPELESALERLSAGEYQLEPHHALEARLSWGGSRTDYLAFNDITIVRRPGAGQVSADLSVGGFGYGYYRADAIVASTPAGSTAYNYAAGGPVLSPALSGSVVTPVAPMAGIDRSVVLAARERYRFDIAEGTRSAALEVDGLVVGEVATGAQLEVRLRKDAGSVVRLDAERHGRTGRLKLGLLDLPLRPDQLIELIPHDLRQKLHRETED